MSWGWILGALGVVAVASLVLWTIWLVHKAADVYHQLLDLAGKLAKLAEQVGRLDLSPLDQTHPRPGDLPGESWAAAGSVAGHGSTSMGANEARDAGLSGAGHRMTGSRVRADGARPETDLQGKRTS